MDIKNMDDRELKTEYKYLYDIIYHEEGCSGTKDMIRLELIEKELNERGIFVHEHRTITFEQSL